MTFAWKRLFFVCEVVIEVHDSPFKGHVFVLTVVYCFGVYAILVTFATCSVVSWCASINYIVIDWVLWGLRVVIVGRLGVKICPRLVMFLVKKHLDNVPAPLLNHADAQGEKTAMRCIQAYFCLCEGELMSALYFL